MTERPVFGNGRPSLKLWKARSRLYRRRFLQVNTRWKAEIYTMHSFAPFWNPLAKNGEKGPGQNNPEKELHRSLISIFSLKIAEFFADFLQIFKNLSEFCLIFAKL